MARLDPLVADHLEWLGFVQPTGLVVSATALVRAGAILDRRDTEGQRLLRECVDRGSLISGEESPTLCGFKEFAGSVLGWSFSPKGYVGTPEAPIPPELAVALPEYGETLKPDYAVRERDPVDGGSPWQLLVRIVPPEQGLDAAERGHGHLEASAHGRMERLLRETGVPAGLLLNGHAVRLISAPRGESSGWLDFNVADMVQTAGRPISTAMRLLLDEQRLLALPKEKRFAALLEDSRKYQNEVSEKLSEQVLHALYELLRGLQSAHDRSNGTLLRQALDAHPDSIYQALLTVVMRLVFLLYAEERDMLPEDETFLRYYSVVGLHERLRENAALHPDTMTQRFGAWAQLLSLFRIIHDGTEGGPMGLPARRGVLFDPDRFPFLEGRSTGDRGPAARIEPPLVPDANVYRALEQLLVLDGERISYRALDVEQLGSVYETMMGFRLETASGRSVAIRSQGKWGAATAVDLEALLTEPPAKRSKWVQDRADRKLTDRTANAVIAAESIDDLFAALAPVIDLAATPDILPEQAMVLQPSEERRRSGSHYTPRSLTEPIVRNTLEPILDQLAGASGLPPRPEELMDLKVCDPAMGSGAFLVEACRQLGDALVSSWKTHDSTPEIPPGEDEVIFARRLVAQRCLYGVDKNPMAVDLAKTSIWLFTLARDHPLTFLAHALRHGDSLVGLSRGQIEAFHWEPESRTSQTGFESLRVRDHLRNASDARMRIRDKVESVPDQELHRLLKHAEAETQSVRLIGDLAIVAFFQESSPAHRRRRRESYAHAVADGRVRDHLETVRELRTGEQGLAVFHWEVEFPEVFDRDDPGFDAIVGNPPFLGGSIISRVLGDAYEPYLKTVYLAGVKGRVDLVTYFLLRSVSLVRATGMVGLVATSQAFEGDSKRALSIGLHGVGAKLVRADERRTWPGQAAVFYRVAYLERAASPGSDSANAERDAPVRLKANAGIAWRGTEVRGTGFVLSDDERQDILEASPRNSEVVSEYINGSDLNTRPDSSPGRWIINFGTMSRDDASQYVEPFQLVTERVKPEREKITKQVHEPDYWKFWDKRLESYEQLRKLGRCLAVSAVTATEAINWVHYGPVFQNKLILFLLDSDAAFSIMQSRVHWLWVTSTTAKRGPSGINYSPTHCFETFAFPPSWEGDDQLEAEGKRYWLLRADLMRRSNEGLTKTYGRFHNPEETSQGILGLRDAHDAIDHAVLASYGWQDITLETDFFLDSDYDEASWGNRKPPWRYRWPDQVQEEVLERLRKLNQTRALAEAREGA